MTTATTAADSTRARAWVAPFVAVALAMIVLQMSNLGFSPLLPAIQIAFALSYTQVGLFTGVYGLIGIVLSIPAGLAARRFGEKTMLLAGLCGVTAGVVILALAPSFPVALAGRVVWLSGYRIAFVCVMIAVAMTAPPRLKGSTMGIVGALSGGATIVGAPFASELEKAIGWRGGFAGYAVLTLIGIGLFASMYQRVGDEPLALPHGARPAPGPPGGRPAHRTPVVWVMAAGLGMLNMGGFTITFFVPVVAKGVFHLTPSQAALIISSAYAGAMVVNLALGYFADRFDRITVLIVVGTGVIVSAFGMLSTNLLVFRFAVMGLVAFGHGATNQGYATVGTVLKGREVGPAMGIVSMASGVYAYMGPQMMGFLRDWTGGFVAGFYFTAGAATLGVALMVLVKYLSADESERPVNA